MLRKFRLLALCWMFNGVLISQNVQVLSRKISEAMVPVYRHLHSNPELSLQEKNTSAYLRQHLKSYGYDILGPFGGFGFVGVLNNGSGPTIMVRADMDALPVKENTGANYASEVQVTSEDGRMLSVMHACGHDIHMASWLGTAQLMSKIRNQWTGTLVFLAQPAEEFGDGARKMLQDGLLNKIPVPDYALALHVSPQVPAGTIGFTSGYAYANVDAMQITIHGRGGHGAYPHTTIDPVVLASRIVLGLQTLVSREFSPLEPVVITVGAINGGSKGNIIPDQVSLNMTIRYHNEGLRTPILEAIERLTAGLAKSAGLADQEYPQLQYFPENLPGVYNDPNLTKRLATIWELELGQDRISKLPATLGGEDFGRFGNTPEDIPICIYWLGGANPEQVSAFKSGGKPPPSLHSSKFLPMERPTLETGIESMSSALLGLLREPAETKD